MKTIDLTGSSVPTLTDVLALAEDDDVIVKTLDGREFVVTEVDDFAQEIEAIRRNPALMQFLEERAKEKGKYSLEEVRRQLDIEE